jgi:hypothetical protein
VGATAISSENQITIQPDGSFSTTFSTATLQSGNYKLEIPKNNEYSYGSGSTLWLFVEVIDRRSELEITSPLTQQFDGTLRVSGAIPSVGNGGLKIQVDQAGATVYGPEYISTSSGAFNIQMPILSGGVYNVTLTDTSNYPWFVQFTVLSPTPTGAVTTPTTIIPQARHASQSASRAQPAYFQVETNPGLLQATTSSGVDWVVEYLDESGTIQKVNTRGTSAEEVRIPTYGGTIYFKIYPDQFDEQQTITLTTENSRSISTCTTCAALFGDAAATTTPATPLSLILVIGALALLAIRRRGS